MTQLTTDTFFDGRIQVLQEQAGYRYSIDAVILAHHAGVKSASRVLDLGTGCGIIPMIMAFRDPDIRIYGIEVQDALAALATENVQANRMADRITILSGDMKAIGPAMIGGPVDLVVVNPPFYRADTGRLNPNSQRAVARHEVLVTLADVVATANRFLGKKGRLMIVYTVERFCDLMVEMRRVGIEPKRLQLIRSADGQADELLIAEGVKGAAPGLRLFPSLVLYDSEGKYTEEAGRMFKVDCEPASPPAHVLTAGSALR